MNFHELLIIAMSESLILFDREYNQQIDGAAVGSPLGPTLPNVFLCYHEQIWLERCLLEFEPVVYGRYLDDTLLLFRSWERIKGFLNIWIVNILTSTWLLKFKNMILFHFLMLRLLGKMITFLIHFVVSQHLVAFPLILKVLYLCRGSLTY